MNEQGSLSTGQRIETLRQYFRSRRSSPPCADAGGSEWQDTHWPDTQWSDTNFDPPTLEL